MKVAPATALPRSPLRVVAGVVTAEGGTQVVQNLVCGLPEQQVTLVPGWGQGIVEALLMVSCRLGEKFI